MPILRKQDALQTQKRYHKGKSIIMYTAKITTKLDVYDAILAELKNSRKDRSEFRMRRTAEGVEFDITARDSTALRAVLNSITKLLTVYEKMEGLK